VILGTGTFVALLWLLTGPEAVPAQTSVGIVYAGAVGPGAVPVTIAHEQGLFAKQAVEPRLVISGPTTAARVTAENPIGFFGAPAALLQAAQGAELKILATLATARVSGHLIAKSEIKTPLDLRRKRFGVGYQIGAGLWINTVLALQHLGLDLRRDEVAFVEIGDLTKIAQALEAGTIDAAVLGPAQSAQLRAKGFSFLLDLYPANLSGPQFAVVVTGPYLRAHPDVVEKVLISVLDGVAFSQAPASKATVLQTLMKTLRIVDPVAAESAYQELLQRLIRKPYPSADSLREMQRVIALHNVAVLNVRLEDVVDDRLVRKLDEAGVIDRLYATYGAK
jgi:ABC-type nitrate/sulfonate/bicarbonate transport system substrate-binding protein